MKRLLLAVAAWLMVMAGKGQYVPEENFDQGWLFYPEQAAGAEQVDYDDASWRKLDLPHDWAIEGPFDPQYDCRTGGLPVHGTGWYRKHFRLPTSAEGKVVRIEFEGAMYDAHVWVNGRKVGNRPYGYIGFEFDISQFLHYGEKENVISVRLTPEDFASRWYPGAGLYRSVWLKIDEPIYIDLWGSYLTTPTATQAKGVVQHETTVVNQTSEDKTVDLQHEYFDAAGNQVAANQETITVSANSKAVSGVWTDIMEPRLWDVNAPNLYSVTTTLLDGDQILDTYQQRFGIRSLRYDPDGFYVNNQPFRFNGVNLHHDNGALGAAIYRRADERKLEIMKAMGVNAIRCSHNPPSRTFLELCDEMGFMVIDEAFDVWTIPKVENGYNKFFNEWAERDLRDMVLRDRNHPSVIMWSLGNEIKEQWRPELGWKMAKKLNTICKTYDTSRPTTIGFNSYPAAYKFNMVQQVDIAGANYKPSKYEEFREDYPELSLYGSETSGVASSRGVYHFPVEKYKKHPSLHVTGYDIIGPPWTYPPDVEFHFQAKNQQVLGEFVWTGFDYLGETSPYGGLDNIDNSGHWNSDWPSRSSYFGIVDLAGFPKDRYYLYQSQWTSEPMIHLMPHWNWPGMEGQTIPVYCYTNCEEAELFVNGKSMGRKVKGEDKTNILIDFLRYEPKTFDSPYKLSWDVPYEPGEIKVIGYRNGQAILDREIKTAGKPAQITLTVDRGAIQADGKDLAYVTVRIVDKDGNFCPLADNLIRFEVRGAGRLLAVDNGDQTSLESFQAQERKAFNGMALAILNSHHESGNIHLVAKGKGLRSASLVVETHLEE